MARLSFVWRQRLWQRTFSPCLPYWKEQHNNAGKVRNVGTSGEYSKGRQKAYHSPLSPPTIVYHLPYKWDCGSTTPPDTDARAAHVAQAVDHVAASISENFTTMSVP